MNDFRTRSGRGLWRGTRKQGAVVAFLALVAGTSIGCSTNSRPAAPNPSPPTRAPQGWRWGRLSGRPRETQLPLLLRQREPRERPGARPRAHAVVLLDRRGRLRPGRLADRRRAGLHLARRSRRPDPRRPAFLRAIRSRGRRRRAPTGHKGFYYHFLDMKSGERFGQVELSTIDTTLLLGGVLFAQGYFDGDDPRETEIRQLADEIYLRVDWPAMIARPPLVSMGWTPEKGLLRLRLAGPQRGHAALRAGARLAHPSDRARRPGRPISKPPAGTLSTATSTCSSRRFSVINTRRPSSTSAASATPTGRKYGLDYFENSRRATLSQQAYAIANPERIRRLRRRILGPLGLRRPGRRQRHGARQKGRAS